MILATLPLIQAICPLLQLPVDAPSSLIFSQLETVSPPASDCVSFAVERGFFQAIHHVSAYPQQISKILPILRRKQKYYSQLLQRKTNDQEVEMQPMTQFDQDQREVRLQIKLSHRWDSPPCTKMLQEDWDYNRDDNSFRLDFKCTMSERILRYKLNFEFYSKVNQVSLSKQGVGTYLLRAVKTDSLLWGTLRNNLTLLGDL